MEIYDFFQNFKINQNRSDAHKADIKATSNQGDIRNLQDQIDHLSLVCQAMCELMEEVGFNKNMLEDKIREIDLRDGKLDGKYNPEKKCSGCSRAVAGRHVKCLYCGTKI